MNVKKRPVKKTESLEKNESVELTEKDFSIKEIKVPPHVGHHFRKIRERKHYTLEEVSKVLRIGVRYLEAIEEGNVGFLPERVYTLGFVRAYALFLGEKPSKCVEFFKQQILLENQNVQLNLPEVLRKSTTPNRIYLFVSVGITVGILLIWFIINSVSKEKQEIPDSIPSDKTLMRSEKSDPAQDQFQKDLSEKTSEERSLSLISSSSDPSLIADKGSEILIPKKDNEPILENKTTEQLPEKTSTIEKSTPSSPINITLSCTEEAWIQVNNAQGEAIFVKTMLPGDTFDVPQKEGLLLYTGNAGGINVSIGDEAPKSLGRKGEVKQHILLDAQSLLSYLSAH